MFLILNGLALSAALVMATDSQDEKVEVILELFSEINDFYLHENAKDFMNNFYTPESTNGLVEARNLARQIKIPNWETELDDATLYELDQLLRSAITNLQPLMMRRGEAVSFGEDLNFRSVPAVETQVLYRLSYGTPFEIIEDVMGGPVTGEEGITSYLWFRIRHDDQSGFVHSRYVRAIPVSEYRINLLADIAREELWIASKIEGWQIRYAPSTVQELQEILNTARGLQVENWQFEFNYTALTSLLEQLSLHHLNLVTLSRYKLINRIVELEEEIGNHVAGTSPIRQEDYTEGSWNQMSYKLAEAQEFLIEEWELVLTDSELEDIYELLRSALHGLEEIPPPVEMLEGENESQSMTVLTTDFGRRLQQLIFVFAGLIGMIVIFRIIKFIRAFNE